MKVDFVHERSQLVIIALPHNPVGGGGVETSGLEMELVAQSKVDTWCTGFFGFFNQGA